MVKNYIFDFGNVLAEFYHERLTAPFVDDLDMRKYISDIVFDRSFWDGLDDGSVSDDDARAEIRKRISGDMQDVAIKVYDNWIESLTPVPHMQKLVEDIKNKGNKLYLLSNISVGFAEGYSRVKWINDLLSMFDGLVLTGKIGLVKPNRDVFEYLLDKYNLQADECIFIDDNEKNVCGAEVVGIKGYLFDGDAQKLCKYLDI